MTLKREDVFIIDGRFFSRGVCSNGKPMKNGTNKGLL
jgi:hypothetical protein